MAIYNKVFGNFFRGVLSKRMQMNYNADYYDNSADEIENFELTSQGNLRKRFGSEFTKDIGAVIGRHSQDDIGSFKFKIIKVGNSTYTFSKISETKLAYFSRIGPDSYNELELGHLNLFDFNNWQYEVSPDEMEIWFATGGKPLGLRRTSRFSIPLEIITTSLNFANSISERPTALTFFQGRLWFSGFAATTNRVVASRSGAYLDFEVTNSESLVSFPRGAVILGGAEEYGFERNGPPSQNGLGRVFVFRIPDGIPIVPNDETNSDGVTAKLENTDVISIHYTGEMHLIHSLSGPDKLSLVIPGEREKFIKWSDIGILISKDSDPLDFEIETSGDIKSLIGGRALHCAHTEGVSTIDSTSIITSGNTFLQRQFTIPMSSVKPIEFNGGFLFVPANRDAVYYAKYSRESRAWVSKIITNNSSHITSGIKEMHRSDNVTEKLCLLLDDGTQSHYTLSGDDDQSNLGGWVNYKSYLNTLSMTYKDGKQHAVVSYGDKVVEVVSNDEYLDCHSDRIVYEGLAHNLSHLAGHQVVVKFDGIVIHRGVVKNNTIYAGVEHNGKTVEVGFDYSSKLKTLPFFGIDDGNVLLDIKKNYDIEVGFSGQYPVINERETFKVDPSRPLEVLSDGFTKVEVKETGYSKDTSIVIEAKEPSEFELFNIGFKGVVNP